MINKKESKNNPKNNPKKKEVTKVKAQESIKCTSDSLASPKVKSNASNKHFKKSIESSIQKSKKQSTPTPIKMDKKESVSKNENRVMNEIKDKSPSAKEINKQSNVHIKKSNDLGKAPGLMRLNTKSSLSSKEPTRNSLPGKLKMKDSEMKSMEKAQKHLIKPKTRASKVIQPKVIEREELNEDIVERELKNKKGTVLIKTKNKLLEDSDNDISEVEAEIQAGTKQEVNSKPKVKEQALSNNKGEGTRFRVSRELHNNDTEGKVKKPEENDNSDIEFDDEVQDDTKVEEKKVIDNKEGRNKLKDNSEIVFSTLSERSYIDSTHKVTTSNLQLPLKEDVKMNVDDNSKQSNNNKNKNNTKKDYIMNNKKSPSNKVQLLARENEKHEDTKVVYGSYDEFLTSINKSIPKEPAKELIKEKAKEHKVNEVTVKDKQRNNKDIDIDQQRKQVDIEQQRKQIMKELKHKAKIKETELNREVACKKIDRVYKKQVLKNLKEAINYLIKRKKAGEKIARVIIKWHENNKKQIIIQMYANHCASIIQRQYRLHLQRIKHHNKPTIQKDTSAEEEINSKKDMKANIDLTKNESKVVTIDDKPLESLGKSSYDIESAIAQDNETKQSTKVVKKPFLRRKEVYDPLKAIKQSKKINTIKEEIKNQKTKSKERKRSIKSFEELTESKKSYEELENSLDDNAQQKPKKAFLKRKVKKVESKKIDWQRVSHRIDCWNQKQEQVEHKEMLNKSLDKVREIKENSEQSLEELKKLYLERHSDQGKIIRLKEYFARDRKNSMIPVLKFQARFFKNYSDDKYEVNYILTIRMN